VKILVKILSTPKERYQTYQVYSGNIGENIGENIVDSYGKVSNIPGLFWKSMRAY